MYSHNMVGANDLEAAKKFYDATFQAIGGKPAITDDKGRLVDSVVPQKPYRYRIYYRVTASISGNWDSMAGTPSLTRKRATSCL